MPGADDLSWVKTTANELNNLLQLISESGQSLERFLPPTDDAEKYLNILRTSTDRAIRVTESIAAHANGRLDPAAPIAPVPTVAAFDGAGAFQIENPQGSRELILIVDDEEFITLLASQVLADDDYRVLTAKNGFIALDIYKKLKDQIDLVILDFVMPVMDGADVFAEMQELNPQVPVVLSSGFAEQDRLRGMLARGLRGFIPKPYTQQKLLEQVRQTLDALKTERARG
jgi:CheY-like chemotaxis protein